MADMIARLKVDSAEYDAKIQRAAKGIQALAKQCHDAGAVLNVLEDENREYIQSLGNMETVATTARGKLAELTAAFTDIRQVYNSLSNEEKNGEFGKELNKQLEIMKDRINGAKSELNDINSEINGGTSSALDQLASKFTINIDALKLFDMGLTATKAALQIAQDAFFASESNVDEWGRTISSCESLYQGFLTALNTGDISGYLNNMNSIVQAARQAYDELDRLGTMKTIQSPKKSAQQTENDRMRMMLQTGRYIAPVDGRKASMQDGQKLTKAQLQTIEKQLQNGMKTVTTLIGNEVKQTGKAIDAVYNRQAKELGMGINEFRKGTSSMAEFDKRMEGYRKYQEWNKKAQGEYAKQGGRGYVNFDKSNPYAEFKKWGTFRVDGDRYNQLVQLIQQRDQQAGQAYQSQGQMYRAINRADNKINPKGGSGSGSTKSTAGAKVEEILPEGSMADLQKKMKELQKEQSLVTDPTDWQIYASLIADVTKKMEELQGKTKQAVPDMTLSKSAQAELDFMMGPTNLDTLHTYIGSIKNDIKNADIGSDMWERLTEKLKDATTMSTLLQELMERGLEGADLEAQAQILKDKLLSPEGIDQEAVQKWLETLSQGIEDAGGIGMALNPQTGEVRDKKEEGKESDSDKEYKKFETKANQFISGLSSVASGLKGLGVEIPESVNSIISVVQSVMQVIQGVHTVIQVFSTSAIAANTAAVTANTMALYAKAFVPFFKNGGIVPHAAGGMLVPGNDYSDNTPVMVSSGELILNKAQQGNIASQLQDSGSQASPSQPYINGEMIYLGLQSYTRRSGLGEIVTAEK